MPVSEQSRLALNSDYTPVSVETALHPLLRITIQEVGLATGCDRYLPYCGVYDVGMTSK